MTSNSLVLKLECDQDTCYLAYGMVPGYPPWKRPEEILGAWLEVRVGNITSFLIGLVARGSLGSAGLRLLVLCANTDI